MPRQPKRTPRPGVDEYGRTPLWNLSFEGDLTGMRQELAAGADPNQGDDAGYTPLHIAIQEKRLEAVNLLLDSGADPRIANKYGNSPLSALAAHEGEVGEFIRERFGVQA